MKPHYLLLSVFLGLFLLLTAQLISASYSSIRCGAYLVDIGAPRYEVISKCGQPADILVSNVERKISDQYTLYWPNRDHKRAAAGASYAMSDSLKIIIQREQFVYDFGSTRLVHILTFEDGILVYIETGEFGHRS